MTTVNIPRREGTAATVGWAARSDNRQSGVSGFIGWLGWGLIHIAFLTGVENRISTLATWLATIARARRTDRTFILGSTTSPEHPYTWLKFMHPNMIDPTHHSGEATT